MHLPEIHIPSGAWFCLLPMWGILALVSFKLRPAFKARGEPRLRLAAGAVWLGYAAGAVLTGYLIRGTEGSWGHQLAFYLIFIQPLVNLLLVQRLRGWQKPLAPVGIAIRDGAYAYLIYAVILLGLIVIPGTTA